MTPQEARKAVDERKKQSAIEKINRKTEQHAAALAIARSYMAEFDNSLNEAIKLEKYEFIFVRRMQSQDCSAYLTKKEGYMNYCDAFPRGLFAGGYSDKDKNPVCAPWLILLIQMIIEKGFECLLCYREDGGGRESWYDLMVKF